MSTTRPAAPVVDPADTLAAAYAHFADRIVDKGLINDPWFDDAPRFGSTPVVLDTDEHRALCDAGEALAAVIDEAVKLLLDDDVQRAQFLPLLPTATALLTASGGMWHGIARADVFVTKDGLQVTELNSGCDHT